MVAIIGAGISGLSLAQMLKQKAVAFEIFEKTSRIGGIAHVETIAGVPFHITGGHCFNSKYPEVLDFVFQNILPETEWNIIEREAKILLKGHLINYPIERSIKEMFSFAPLLALKILISLCLPSFRKVNNLEDWFIKKFGRVLAKEYFIPYNQKIWQKSLKQMDPLWVEDKLPMTSRWEILKSFFGEKETKMPHSQFYYPKQGDNQLVKALSKNLNIHLNSELNPIKKVNSKWILNSITYDQVVYTGPLNLIADVFAEVPLQIQEDIKALKYNKITTSLWEADSMHHTWTYIPKDDSPFHRHVHIGNFISENKNNYTIAEKTGVHSRKDIEAMGQRVKGFNKLVAHYTSDHAYVIFDEQYKGALGRIVSYFESEGIVLLGRFAEWQYYNMDICMKRALEVAKKMEENYEVH